MVTPYVVEGETPPSREAATVVAGARAGTWTNSPPIRPAPGRPRVAVVKAADQQVEDRRDHLVLIQNFFDELRRVAPAGKR